MRLSLSVKLRIYVPILIYGKNWGMNWLKLPKVSRFIAWGFDTLHPTGRGQPLSELGQLNSRSFTLVKAACGSLVTNYRDHKVLLLHLTQLHCTLTLPVYSQYLVL